MRTAAAVLAGVIAGLLVAIGLVVTLGPGDSASREDRVAGGTAPTSTTAVDRGGDVLVFLDRWVTDDERRGIEAVLDDHAQVADYQFWDQTESLAEARRLFSGNAEMLAKLDQDPGIIPSSYRITLTSADPQSAGRVVADLDGRAGVKEMTVVQET
jgi:cell division protein FtsX